jgi:diguanylate cyclase (GGDEF)-like protein
VEIATHPLTDQDPGLRYFVSVQRIVTERKQAQQQLAYQAYHDPLTDLPNRALLESRTERALARASRYNEAAGLLYLDIDDFKRVNDTLGHSGGDQLLKEVALRLSTSIRPTDTAARLGGDEFAVLLEDVVESGEVELVAGRILDSMRRPFYIDNQTLLCSTSIGASIVSPDVTTFEDLLKRADKALYIAKVAGKDRLVMGSDTLLTPPPSL